MDELTLVRTRRSLHAVAEYVLAGPQYARSQDIKLRIDGAAFATVAPPDLRVEADAIVTPDARLTMQRTARMAAIAAGVEPRDLRDVYATGPELGVDDPLLVDLEAAAQILQAFARGDEAMRRFAPNAEPVLWPEHFDVGISVGEVNYGISPGDASTAEPYAYVGPWRRRTGAFWNADFGACRLMRELPAVDDVVAFFRSGRMQAGEPSQL